MKIIGLDLKKRQIIKFDLAFLIVEQENNPVLICLENQGIIQVLTPDDKNFNEILEQLKLLIKEEKNG